MESDPKVSIIVPVYKVEPYLAACVESLLRQTYREIEIILVDDGSPDNCGIMCDAYALRDSRVKVIHQENQGLSVARNSGTDVASGEYIMYLDADDYLSSDCISKSVQMCNDHNADIAIMRMMNVSEETNEEIRCNEKEFIKVMSPEEAIEASLYQVMFSCSMGKFYKKNILDGIKFPAGRLSEDLATCHLFLDKAKRVVYTNAVGYYYRQHSNSISHNISPKRMDALEWALNIEKFCEEKYPNILPAAKCRTFNVAVHLLLDLPNDGEMHDKYFKELWKEIRRTRLQTLFSKKARFREKAAALLSFSGEKTMKRVWNSRFAVKQKIYS